MKKLLLVLLLLAPFASAQESAITAPVAQAKYTVYSFTCYASPLSCNVNLAVKDSSNNVIRYFQVTDTDGVGFLTALDTVRATETGSVPRKAQFRILGRLFDAGLTPGVTPVP